jgi:large subunit ribosomal protein L3
MNQNIGLIAKKVGMTHVYDKNGVRRAATVLYTPKCVVTAVRSAEKNGYTALQVGIISEDPKEKAQEKNVNKPTKGQFKNGVPTRINEFRVTVEDAEKFKVGDTVNSDIFEKGQKVDVRGKTLGKGFQGVMKRYGFAGFIASHGTHESFRGGGSIGQCAWPAHVIKGRKMPGQMGNKNRSVLNLEVLDINVKENTLVVSGAVPGSTNTWLQVRRAVKS